MLRACFVVLFLLSFESACWASPYVLSWDASDGLPEAAGVWSRVWGDWDGLYHGTGANRTIRDGVLTYDSLYDEGVYDYNEIVRPGQIDPGPGETIIMEWRLRVDEVTGWRMDPGVALSGDDRWNVAFEFAPDHLESAFEGSLSIPITPGQFHDYRLVTGDMRVYDLYIDNTLARHGAFAHLASSSRVTWGDGVEGAASLHDWERFRLAVVPEPSGGCNLAAYLACSVRRRVL